MVVLDSRPFDEYARISIPTGINVPGAELVLRVHDIAPSPDTLVVVNCAGRTRSIIGAQSLINAGVPNKVVALRNGTMGWHLAGFDLRQRQDRALRRASRRTASPGRSRRPSASRASSASKRIDRDTLERWRADTTRTLYVFDVRDPAEYEAGHFPGAISAPGGQLVQATDQYAGTLGARIVLVDDDEVRAVMTASWLKQMGWQDVAVLPEAGDRKGPAGRPTVLGTRAGGRARSIRPTLLRDRRRHRRRSLAQPELPQGPHSRRLVRHPRAARPGAGEDPAAWHAGAHLGGRRARRPRRRGSARAHRHCRCAGSRAATPPGPPPAFRCRPTPSMADEPLDVWLKPYERAGDPKAAMNEYLSWEVDLLERIERDGTTHFAAA